MRTPILSLALLLLGTPLGAQVTLATYSGAAAGDSHCVALGGVDLDLDGRKDVIVGAPFEDTGFPDAGAVRAYSGTSQTVLWSLSGGSGNAWCGAALAWTDDVDGDGVADVLIGEPYLFHSGLVRGAARVHSGATGAVLHAWYGDHAFEGFGAAVTAQFDWNGDGVNDFAVGAPFDDDTFFDAGKFAVYDGTNGVQLGQVHGDGPDQLVGWSLASVGYVDLVSSPDLAVGAPSYDGPGGVNSGQVTVYGRWGVKVWSWAGDNAGDSAGYSVCGMGDWSGDNVDDVLVGSPNAFASAGTVNAIDGLSGTLLLGPWSLSTSSFDWAGYSVVQLEDQDGDGVSDVAVGVPEAQGNGPGYVHILSSLGINVMATLYGDANGDQAGWTVANAGDMDQDGNGDLLIGASGANGGAGWARVVSLNDCSAVAYCTAGTSASGCQATLTTTGVPSATAPTGFTVQALGVEGDKDGLFFFGWNGRQASPWGNGASYQCVAPPVKRGGLLPGSGTPATCTGALSQDLNARWTARPLQNPGAGAVVQLQCWYRDPFNTSNQTTSLSDAVEFVVCP